MDGNAPATPATPAATPAAAPAAPAPEAQRSVYDAGPNAPHVPNDKPAAKAADPNAAKPAPAPVIDPKLGVPVTDDQRARLVAAGLIKPEDAKAPAADAKGEVENSTPTAEETAAAEAAAAEEGTANRHQATRLAAELGRLSLKRSGLPDDAIDRLPTEDLINLGKQAQKAAAEKNAATGEGTEGAPGDQKTAPVVAADVIASFAKEAMLDDADVGKLNTIVDTAVKAKLAEQQTALDQRMQAADAAVRAAAATRCESYFEAAAVRTPQLKTEAGQQRWAECYASMDPDRSVLLRGTAAEFKDLAERAMYAAFGRDAVNKQLGAAAAAAKKANNAAPEPASQSSSSRRTFATELEKKAAFIHALEDTSGDPVRRAKALSEINSAAVASK